MSGAHDIFTNVTMSTPLVFAETREVVARRGLSLRVLEEDFDVDLPEDLPRLVHRLEQDAALRWGQAAQLLRRLLPGPPIGEFDLLSSYEPCVGTSIKLKEAYMAQAGQSSDVTVLIRTLSDRIVEMLERLATLTDDELDAPCGHPCATAGTVRSLLTHNVDHERMHVGQVYNIRYEARMMQNAEVARLLGEWLRDRALLISSLYGLSDADLDRRHAEGEYSIRETIEHVLYWEKDSVDGLLAERGGADGYTHLGQQPQAAAGSANGDD
jgi:uncharacterized damage-inducible protein DinB